MIQNFPVDYTGVLSPFHSQFCPQKLKMADSPELLLAFEIFSDSEFIIDELMVDSTTRQGPFTNQNGSESVAKQRVV